MSAHPESEERLRALAMMLNSGTMPAMDTSMRATIGKYQIALLDEVQRLRASLAEAEPLIRFAAWAIGEMQEDVEGVQDEAVKLGVLEPVAVTEPCGHLCRCEEFDNFPGECFRYTARVAAAIDRAALHTAEDTEK